MRAIGIDLGSSSIKAAILDLAQGRVEAIRKEPFPNPLANLPPRYFEVDPSSIVAATRRVLESLAALAPDATDIFCCSQMGGVILIDPTSGAPLTNYLSWRDQRTLNPASATETYLEAAERLIGPAVFAEIGRELKPGATSALLFWLQAQGALPASAIPASLGEFVISQLGGAPPQWEPTTAIGLLNLVQGGYHQGLQQALGLQSLNWPKIAIAAEPVGEISLGGRTRRLFPALGDQQTALLGAGLTVGELSLNISTGSQVSQITPTMMLGNYQTRPYFAGQFLNTLTHLPAGRSLNVIVDLLTELPRAAGLVIDQPWRLINQAVQQVTETDLKTDLSFFSGPMGDTGQISAITVDNLRVGDLFLAAFHNMADNYRRCAELLCPNRDWQRVVISGGLTAGVPALRRELLAAFPGETPRESFEQEETLMGLLKHAQNVSGGH